MSQDVRTLRERPHNQIYHIPYNILCARMPELHHHFQIRNEGINSPDSLPFKQHQLMQLVVYYDGLQAAAKSKINRQVQNTPL